MVDKVKPLKLEDPTSGTGTNFIPTETDASQDYLATKGIAFENLDTHVIDKIGRVIYSKEPNGSIKPTYLANGELDYLEIFTGATQLTADRVARVEMTYDSNIDPATEVWKIYDTNGTTILRTLTFTHTFTSTNLTNTTAAFT